MLEAVLPHEQRHQRDVAVVHRLQRDPRAVSNKRAEASAVWLLLRSRPAPGLIGAESEKRAHLLQSKFACVTRSFIPSRIFLSREPWRSRASNMVECCVERCLAGYINAGAKRSSNHRNDSNQNFS